MQSACRGRWLWQHASGFRRPGYAYATLLQAVTLFYSRPQAGMRPNSWGSACLPYPTAATSTIPKHTVRARRRPGWASMLMGSAIASLLRCWLWGGCGCVVSRKGRTLSLSGPHLARLARDKFGAPRAPPAPRSNPDSATRGSATGYRTLRGPCARPQRARQRPTLQAAVCARTMAQRVGRVGTSHQPQLCSPSGSAAQASADARTSTHATLQVRLHRAGPPAPTPVSPSPLVQVRGQRRRQWLHVTALLSRPQPRAPWQRGRLQRSAAVLRQPLLSCFSVVAHRAGARVRGAARLHRLSSARTARLTIAGFRLSLSLSQTPPTTDLTPDLTPGPLSTPSLRPHNAWHPHALPIHAATHSARSSHGARPQQQEPRTRQDIL
jgi:hypothetical protein